MAARLKKHSLIERFFSLSFIHYFITLVLVVHVLLYSKDDFKKGVISVLFNTLYLLFSLLFNLLNGALSFFLFKFSMPLRFYLKQNTQNYLLY
jgi:hypothetical protein